MLWCGHRPAFLCGITRSSISLCPIGGSILLGGYIMLYPSMNTIKIWNNKSWAVWLVGLFWGMPEKINRSLAKSDFDITFEDIGYIMMYLLDIFGCSKSQGVPMFCLGIFWQLSWLPGRPSPMLRCTVWKMLPAGSLNVEFWWPDCIESGSLFLSYPTWLWLTVRHGIDGP